MWIVQCDALYPTIVLYICASLFDERRDGRAAELEVYPYKNYVTFP